LQQGLVAEDKWKRVENYVRCVRGEVEMIAHSVGVNEPRSLQRRHVRLMQPNGISVPMDVLYPARIGPGNHAPGGRSAIDRKVAQAAK
jgi:hypothetical protein